MNKLKVIITGATGMVGEGVLMECLQNEQVSEVLIANRKHYDKPHPKLKELLIPDFNNISEENLQKLSGYEACFYCAGVSSIGMNEEDYTAVTYTTTLNFAKALLKVNKNMIFHFVTGASTESTEKGKLMWARVKGKTENDLMKLPFNGQYNFRPGFMKSFKEQKNVKFIFKVFNAFYPYLFPSTSLTLQEVGRAMISLCYGPYEKQVLEIKDIKLVAYR